MVDGFGADISFTIVDSSGVDNELGMIGLLRDGADNSGAFQFRSYNAGALSEKLRITSSGNMGIGDAAPAQKLSVTGNIAATGMVTGTNITIIQGVDLTQNANITIIQGVDLTQNASIAASFDKANSKTYTFAQNTTPTTANGEDLWVHVDTGVVYQNFGNTTNPVWAEFGPSGQLANTQPGIITATSGTFSGQLNVAYQPATTVGSAIQITAANTQGGTGYADAIKITNTSAGVTNPNKTIRLTSIGELQVVNSAYQMTPLSLTDGGDLTLAGNSTTNGIAAGYAPNRPAFKVTGNGGSISATTTVAGGYMVVDYNQGSYLNTTTGIFTAPVAGLYQVNVVIRTQSNANPAINQIIIRKTAAIGGAVTTQIMVEFGVNTTMNHTGGSALVKLAVGDTLKFDVTSGSISFDGNDNWSVAYIG
jgi:hypothetical protein